MSGSLLQAIPKKIKPFPAMIARIITAVSCLMVAVLVGCKGEKISPHLIDQAGTLSGVLEIQPNPPVPMQDTLFLLSLTDSGQAVQSAEVDLTLTMPGCTMAPSFLQAAAMGEGYYQVKTVLTMAGAWKVDARITRHEQEEELIFFFVTK